MLKRRMNILIVHVFINVRSEYIKDFKDATIENARNSIQEQGISRFDLIQQIDNPARFLLVEVYRTKEDTQLHKETAHYKKWRETVEHMMAEPRKSIQYSPVFPNEI